MALRFLPLRLPTPRAPRTFRAAQSAPRGCLPSAATLRLPQVPPSQALGNIPTGMTMAVYLNATRSIRRRGLRGLCCRLPDWLVSSQRPIRLLRPLCGSQRPDGSQRASGAQGSFRASIRSTPYADQIATVQFNLSRLHTGNTLTWVLQHPAVLVPVAIVECASKRPNPLGWRAPVLWLPR